MLRVKFLLGIVLVLAVNSVYAAQRHTVTWEKKKTENGNKSYKSSVWSNDGDIHIFDMVHKNRNFSSKVKKRLFKVNCQHEGMWIKKISGDFPEGVIARYFHIPSDGSRRYGTFCFQVKDEPKAGTVEFGYKKAFTLYNAYNYEEALKLFLFVYTNFPKHRLAPDAMFMAGQCLAVMKSYKESIAVHKALIASYPKSYCVAHAYFRIACLTAGLLEKHEEGIELFTNIIKLFPTDPIAQDSLFCIAALHLIDENTQQATEEFALLATKYPNSYRGKAAKANLAELANVSK